MEKGAEILHGRSAGRQRRSLDASRPTVPHPAGSLDRRGRGPLAEDWMAFRSPMADPGCPAMPGGRVLLVVRLGEYDLSKTSDGPTLDMTPAAVLVHPGYAAKQNDLAVLRLGQPVPLGTHIQPVCLPPPGRPAAALAGRPALLAGWGNTAFAGQTSDVLQQVELVVVAPADCEARYRVLPSFADNFPGGFQGSKLCAAGENGAVRDACGGDSGGPLVQQLGDGSYQLIGIVSAGVGCGNPDYPGLYTRVSAYTDWIMQNIA
ncbi:anionic trypsin-1-like [Pollicipes pollicipes]|uniref:anionic trypsin-1-like n=1 Tax=Pollicipes pollicipes TaxID=41117 RepID=UPI001884D26C|nr:anionic trypsin-1-like [Pollicipes pollicipes]